MPSPRRSSQPWQQDHQASSAQAGNLKGLRRDSYVQQEDAGSEGQLIYLHAPSSPAGYLEYPDYAPGQQAWPVEDHREPLHAADTLYDYFGIPIAPHQQQNHAAMVPTPPYSPLYSPNATYHLNPEQMHLGQQQHPHQLEPAHHHQTHYHPESISTQNGYISPNDVHMGRSPVDHSWGPVAHDEYYMEPRGRNDSFDAYTQHQTLLWEQGDAPISPRPSWGSESPRQHDEIQLGESASSPKSSQGDAELRVTESATPFISKLSHLLNSPEYDTFIRWSSRGNCFIFAHNDPLLLASFAKYFRHSNCQSFVRQLNIYGFTRLNATELHATMATSQLESHPLPADEFSAFIHPRFYRDEPGRPCPVGQLKPRVAKKKASKGGDLSSHLTLSPVVMAKINIKAAMAAQAMQPQKRSARKSEIMRRPHADLKPSVFEVPTEPGSWYQGS